MRVSNISLFNGIMSRLGSVSQDMIDAQEVVTTTKRINNISDDPVGMVSVLDLRASLSNIEQMGRNIDVGRSWLEASESSLDEVQDILVSTKGLTIQMSSATTKSYERANAVTLVDGYLKQIVALADSEVGGRYIFGGTNTKTTPFELNAEETQVDYSGNDTPFSIKIGKNNNVEIGWDGEDIFGENWDNDNIFKTLIDLKTYLETDDVDGIQGILDRLDSHADTLSAAISEIGGRSTRLDVREQIIDDLDLSYTDRKSRIEDADITEAIIALNSKQLAYNAALTSASKVMQLSLVDFL